jgi:hypothetical protein
MHGDVLIMKMHDLYDNEMSSNCLFHRKRSFRLHRPVLAIATLSPVSMTTIVAFGIWTLMFGSNV